uniref:Transcription elongation factor A N-terminal and central domain containing n=1 Tax=Hucho hucho TaxID=62062 RepID=A0A4W5QBL0_9TELE
MTTMDTKQIPYHALQMDKFNRAGNYGNIMPLLTALDNACVTCEQLQGTDIVTFLYRLLKTCSDHSVKKTAKHLLSKWKQLYSHPYHISKEKGSEEEYVHIHALHRANQAKYKACIRSKVANLRNPKNVHLRCCLLGGSLGPEVFAGMSVEEMANEELQRLREEYLSRGVSERQLPQGVEGTPTQKLRCRRCEGLDCRVQHPGAHQDAMTFVTCSRCGEQWYHSGWVCL